MEALQDAAAPLRGARVSTSARPARRGPFRSCSAACCRWPPAPAWRWSGACCSPTPTCGAWARPRARAARRRERDLGRGLGGLDRSLRAHRPQPQRHGRPGRAPRPGRARPRRRRSTCPSPGAATWTPRALRTRRSTAWRGLLERCRAHARPAPVVRARRPQGRPPAGRAARHRPARLRATSTSSRGCRAASCGRSAWTSSGRSCCQVVQLDRWDDPHAAIEAFRLAKAEEPELQLVLAGLLDTGAAEDWRAAKEVSDYAAGEDDLLAADQLRGPRQPRGRRAPAARPRGARAVAARGLRSGSLRDALEAHPGRGARRRRAALHGQGRGRRLPRGRAPSSWPPAWSSWCAIQASPWRWAAPAASA